MKINIKSENTFYLLNTTCTHKNIELSKINNYSKLRKN